MVTKIRVFFEKFAQEGLEIETLVLPISRGMTNGKEVTIDLTSSSIRNTVMLEGQSSSSADASGNSQQTGPSRTVFHTDANGLYMQKRILNYKEGFDLENPIIPSVNYYPVTSAIYIQDQTDNKRLTIMNDRSQGGSSLDPGRVELMIHRAMITNDRKGLNEGCDEVEEYTRTMINVTVTHRIYLSNGHG